MASNGLTVTVVGWAATNPREIVGDGVPFTSFRVATTPRWFDNRQGTWADGRTEWITVKAFRDVAHNIAASIRKGDPVLVHGRLQTEEWEGEKGLRTGLVIEVSAIGHDLTKGKGTFVRRTYLGGEGAGATDDAEEAVRGGASAASATSADDDPWATRAGDQSSAAGLAAARDAEPDDDGVPPTP